MAPDSYELTEEMLARLVRRIKDRQIRMLASNPEFLRALAWEVDCGDFEAANLPPPNSEEDK